MTGTTVLDAADPSGDDHGPGTFQYPTSTDFHDGAFDLTRFQVVQNGDTTYLRAKVRDLSPTFGNALGAQLLTVFVHEKGVPGSTRPLYASRNYSVASEDAWARAVQVRGFDETRVFDASGAQVGTANAQASQLSGYVTIAVPTSLLGAQPASGWSFIVVTHGQDGYGEDGARTFAETPQPYQFGRCPTSSDSSPICSVPLNQLPKAMDVLVPAGTSQAQELDPTSPPVVLRGAAVP